MSCPSQVLRSSFLHDVAGIVHLFDLDICSHYVVTRISKIFLLSPHLSFRLHYFVSVHVSPNTCLQMYLVSSSLTIGPVFFAPISILPKVSFMMLVVVVVLVALKINYIIANGSIRATQTLDVSVLTPAEVGSYHSLIPCEMVFNSKAA